MSFQTAKNLHKVRKCTVFCSGLIQSCCIKRHHRVRCCMIIYRKELAIYGHLPGLIQMSIVTCLCARILIGSRCTKCIFDLMIIVKTLFDRLIVGSWPLYNNCDWLCEKGPHAIINVFEKMCKKRVLCGLLANK